MRRLPIYFLIDVSESMVGEPITQVEKGMRNIIQELRTDPYALETVFVSVIVFAGKAKVLSPLTELYKFYPPQFPIGGGTSLGTALDCLMNDIDKSVKKTTVEMKVTETEPTIKGATAASGGKPATMETGLVVTVPDFINVGDTLVINTTTGEYKARA